MRGEDGKILSRMSNEGEEKRSFPLAGIVSLHSKGGKVKVGGRIIYSADDADDLDDSDPDDDLHI